MHATKWVGIGWLALFGAGCGSGTDAAESDEEVTGATDDLGAHPSRVERLGKLIFFDERLSQKSNQSCAACHAGPVGWTGPAETVNATGGSQQPRVERRLDELSPRYRATPQHIQR